MGRELSVIEQMYDLVANEYSEAFYGEHEKKPKENRTRKWSTKAEGRMCLPKNGDMIVEE